MICNKCKKECLESELTNGYCNECINLIGENNNDNYKKNIENTTVKKSKFVIVFLCIIIVGLISCCGYLINKTITLENKINEIENKTNEIENKTNEIENSLKKVESTARDARLKVTNLIKILGYDPLSYKFNITLP